MFAVHESKYPQNISINLFFFIKMQKKDFYFFYFFLNKKLLWNLV